MTDSHTVEEYRCTNFNNLQLLTREENRTKGDYYVAAKYALTAASIAIEKLVLGWKALYGGVSESV
jgi:hypothetical protein